MLSRITLVFAAFIAVGFSACVNQTETSAQRPAASSTPVATSTLAPPTADAELAARLKAICERAGGRCGVAVTHVETGRSVAVEGDRAMPLYSVFKLPLAVTVLKEVEEGRLQLDQKVRVEPEEAAPGVKSNSDLWLKASDRTIRELLEFSIVRSDNTSSDKLLELVGGPDAVTRRMRALGLQNIEVRASTREFLKNPDAHPNTGTPDDLARLLSLLQKGEALAPPQLEVLLGLMGRAVTGDRRLRAGPPAGTPVADKTGTGPSTTNDVGLITLPGDKGHLALAVLLDGSKLTAEKQEDLIAEVARTAFDAHVSGK
ncbi:MAG: beta-lactamase class [Acidobacteriota bacterium]|nr:beta-lactamase class [Acidobacteriota bacterium]